jgi:hypothetical protein
LDRIEELVTEMAEAFERLPSRPFPYEDLQRVRRTHPLPFRELGEDDLLDSDLNEHLMMVAGLVSGGIRRWLADPTIFDRLALTIRQDFFSRHPQYNFLMKIDLSDYPELQAELRESERLRSLLVDLIDEIEAEGTSAAR